MSLYQRAAADVVGMLTSFEGFDALSRAGHSEEQILSTLKRLVYCASDQLLGNLSVPLLLESSPTKFRCEPVGMDCRGIVKQ